MDKKQIAAFALTNRVPTVNGWKHIDQLTSQDRLFKWDGTPVRIRRIRWHTTLAMHVRLADGREYVCSEYAKLMDDMPVYKAMKYLEHTRNNGLPKNFHLPAPGPAAHKQQQPVPMQPYLMGLISANRTVIHSDRFEISNIRNCSANQLEADYTLKNGLLTIPFNKNASNIRALRRAYHSNLELITKFISREYMTNNIETRRELLAGMMDASGRPTTTYCRLTDMCETMRQDALTLAYSLGMTAIETPAREVKIFSKNVPSYRANYRKQIENANTPKNADHGLVRRIRCEGFTKRAEIELEGNIHGFLLENYIPVLN